MIEEIKVEGIEKVAAGLAKLKAGTVPTVTAADAGKVLTAAYDAEAEEGSAGWADVDALPEITESDEGKLLKVSDGAPVWGNITIPAGLVYNSASAEHIGQYEVVSGQDITVHEIKSLVVNAGTTKYSNPFTLTIAAIGKTNYIISMFARCTYGVNVFYIPCTALHNEATDDYEITLCSPSNTDIPNNGIYIDKIFVNFIDMTNV